MMQGFPVERMHYVATDGPGYLMQDIHSMLLGENEQKMKYLFQLK